MNYSLALSINQLKLVEEMYLAYIVGKDLKNVIFKAVKNDVTITLYTNHNLFLEGDYKKELKEIKLRLGLSDFSAIGSDEVGTGDVFGPIVVCSTYVPKDMVETLEDLGVKDSKTMTDKKIIELAPQITKLIQHSVLILKPEKYNEMVRKGYNMNKIKAFLHNQAIILTSDKVEENVPVILDQFCEPRLYFNYLKDEKKIYKDVSFYIKAESVHISVAAASIIARYAFLAKMQEFSRNIGFKLALGAGNIVDRQLVRIYKNKGYDALRPITKLNFKNIKKNEIVPHI